MGLPDELRQREVVEQLDPVLSRELEYHERLYSGFAQRHFARPAVRAFREHLAAHIVRVTGAGSGTRVLSLGCGIGDTELLLARHVGEIVGLDLSPAAIRQATQDGAGVANVRFLEGALDSVDLPERSFDVVLGIFFLHHLSDPALLAFPFQAAKLLVPGGKLYALDPSRQRLGGAIGSLLFPSLMRKYQTPDERELDSRATAVLFHDAGFNCERSFYDFVSTPLAGLLPGWQSGYRAARALDELLVRLPGVRALGSNFELIATARQ